MAEGAPAEASVGDVDERIERTRQALLRAGLPANALTLLPDAVLPRLLALLSDGWILPLALLGLYLFLLETCKCRGYFHSLLGPSTYLASSRLSMDTILLDLRSLIHQGSYK